MTKTLRDHYLDYLGSQVVARRALEKTHELCEIMQAVPFVWHIPNDDNREQDGLDVRVQWLMEFDGRGLQGPVSFLEMLVGLTRRASYMRDELTPQEWAEEILHNLQLDQMWDPLSQRKRTKAVDIVEAVVWRNYRRDGSGGMFPLDRPRYDQRKVEIWHQLNAYVMQNYPL